MLKQLSIKRIGYGLSLALFSILSLPLSVHAQSAGIGGRVANPDPNNARSQSIFIYNLDHSQSKSDQILVANHTDSLKTIKLGSVDGVATNTGAYTCRQAAEPVQDSGGWVELSEDSVTLPAGGEQLVNFTIKVPDNADVGEHNSCITMQADDDVVEAASGVRLRMRQAIRMVITIPGELKRSLSIDHFAVSSSQDEQRYDISVVNRGNVSADVDMQIVMTNLFGKEVTRTGGEYPVIPNQTLSQQFATKYQPLFGGLYYVTPSIKYDKRLGVYGTQDGGQQYDTKIGDKVFLLMWPTVPGWIIIISALVLMTSLIIWIIRRRRKYNNLVKSSTTYTVKHGDSVQALADKLEIKWKDLAKLNKLSAPYTISEGQIIKLPIKARASKKKS